MKRYSIILILLVALTIESCVSVRVTTDYDTKTNFAKYETFAFYKKGIDNADINDLDKRRIMYAIEDELTAKGMKKSENPDVLVNIFTKSREKVDVYNNMHFGWYPWYYGPGFGMQYSRYTEGTLSIDIIDAQKKEMVWQGIGSGVLNNLSGTQKEARIKEFVKEILAKYPPSKN
ncbi:MAG: DUF4136 domain-containing protein [Flavobacteriaceae bacterium]|nr:DUF4136 domain-containing protein [Flavobacteriaceae bacterium]